MGRVELTRPFSNRSGNCGCFSIILAFLLLPGIVAHPVIGFLILPFLVSRK